MRAVTFEAESGTRIIVEERLDRVTVIPPLQILGQPVSMTIDEAITALEKARDARRLDVNRKRSRRSV